MARQQIKVGDKLLIPSTPATPATTSAASSSSQSPKKHRVETGETLYGISRSYGIDLADLLRANPGVTSSTVKVGMELVIPGAKGDSATTTAPKSDEGESSLPPSQVAASQTRILMLLPLKKDKHFVEFYEGFLLGMYQLKKAGISIQLTTLDVPNDDALNAYIDAGKLRGKDLVIGGVTEGQIRAISAASGYNYYIIPFSKASHLETGDGRVILTNAHTSTIIDRVVPAFLQKYRVAKSSRLTPLATRKTASSASSAQHSVTQVSPSAPYRSVAVPSVVSAPMLSSSPSLPTATSRWQLWLLSHALEWRHALRSPTVAGLRLAVPAEPVPLQHDHLLDVLLRSYACRVEGLPESVHWMVQPQGQQLLSEVQRPRL